MDADERVLFVDTLRRACESSSGAALDRALDEVGWTEALSVDPRLAVASLFDRLGSTNATASALPGVVASALGLGAGPPVAVVLPAPGRWHPPARMADGHLVVHGLGVASLTGAITAWVVAGGGGDPAPDADADAGAVAVAVEVAVTDLTLRPVQGVDPRLGLVEVTADRLPVPAPLHLRPDAWPQAVARARLALGHELVGASRAMLELARSHAAERIQFGRPIATFQAVRHRLADALVAIEAADAALGSAWDEGSPAAAASAKALAGRSARTTARHSQQVLAGIGFTTGHALHHYVRRVLVLDQLFGTARTLTGELGAELLATRQLPPLPPL